MSKKIIVPFLATLLLALVSLCQAQTKIYRIGVILQGGPYYAAVDGLKDRLKELGFGAVGSDPVAAGLVESFARPGGRLTGVYRQSSDVDAKRLEILKAILPDLHQS